MYRIERDDFLSARPRYPISEAQQFIETRMIIPGNDTVYSDELNRFVAVEEAAKEKQISDEMWKQADEAKEGLFAMMNKVRTKLDQKAKSQEPSLDLRRCSWDEVMQEVDLTSRRWETSSQGVSKTIFYVDRIGRSSDAFRDWLQLLPAGDYGSSICGVFKLAVGAADQYSKIEEVVIQTLSEIPETMQNARRYIEIYSDMRTSLLQNMTFELFMAIIRTLTEIMQFFADSGFRKLCESLMKQSAYKQKLLDRVEEIKKHTVRIKEEASLCFQERSFNQVKRLLANQENSENRTQRIYELLCSHILSNTHKSHLDRAAIEDEGPGGDRQSERFPAAIPGKAGEEMSARVIEALLELLQYDPETTSRDIARVLLLGGRLENGPRAKAASMVQHDLFRGFMADNLSSSSLLVNGRDDLAAVDGPSPLSFVAAELVRISEATGSIFVVKYFCDQHPPYTELTPPTPPIAMMASLVGQLVRQMIDRGVEVDLSFLGTTDWHHMKKMKLSILCILFRELVKQLPAKSVLLCVVNEISLYETATLESDTGSIMRRLCRFFNRKDDIVFKLLITCRGKALGISEYFHNHTLDLDEFVEPTDASRWQISTISK